MFEHINGFFSKELPLGFLKQKNAILKCLIRLSVCLFEFCSIRLNSNDICFLVKPFVFAFKLFKLNFTFKYSQLSKNSIKFLLSVSIC